VNADDLWTSFGHARKRLSDANMELNDARTALGCALEALCRAAEAS
jgi:hypothetical protein